MTAILRRVFSSCAVAALICLTTHAVAQTVQEPPPQFEVAAIKPVGTDGLHQDDLKVFPDGRIVIHGHSLKNLVQIAFHLGYWQVSGGEQWVDKDLYDIEAKAPSDPAVTYDVRYTWWQIEDPRLRAMLQSLLIERFNLRLRPQSTTGQIYVLAAGGKTKLMHPTEAATATHPFGGVGHSGDISHGGDRWVIYNTSMQQMAQFIGDVVMKCPVIDRTGLTGYFDAEWTETQIDPDKFDSMDSFPMFLQALGLKLTKSTGTVQTFVIEHADPPSPN